MVRGTIDFGIDLGTTNSSIAVFKGTSTEVFKNNEGQEYTPSAVWIDGKGKLYVGRLAKERLEDDSENAYCEFKLQMGKDQPFVFARTGRKMRPEELSAEVLKSLRTDVKQRTGEDVFSSIISVPAAFELPQTNATNEAARLAGLEYVQLVQEPVAAAIAYGFSHNSTSGFWMVYDFGGGTFDVAVIQLHDGKIEIVNHAGDNHLGGKLIDWEIVEKVLVPAVTKQYRLSNFNRSNPQWKAAFAKLKLHAEQAKIQLSRTEEISILIESLCKDENNQPVRFEYELKRREIEPLISPFIERSINLCKKTMSDSSLSSSNVEKVIMVGGPTLTPIIRQMLGDRLGITLDFSQDPLTVNAQGAAIFAGGIRIPSSISNKHREVKAGQYIIELHYKPIGNEPNPMVGGKVTSDKIEIFEGFSVEIIDKKSQWRSGKVKLTGAGTFTVDLHTTERYTEFFIELKDVKGNLCSLVPDHFSYNNQIDVGGQPLINTIGIALANTQMKQFILKGTTLPARKRYTLHTTRDFRRGTTGELLRIPVVEGEHFNRADRNRLIGALEIPSTDVKRDVPLGSEVEVTIVVDDSRIVVTKAYIPILDEEFENVLKYDSTPANPVKLKEEYQREKSRFEKACKEAQKAGFNESNETMHKIHDEDMIQEIESLLAAANNDRDAAEKCSKRLLDFEIAIDEIEDAGKWPILVTEAEEIIIELRKQMDRDGSDADKANFKSLERETRAAMAATGETNLLKQKIEQLHSLYWGIVLRRLETWVVLFQGIEENQSDLTDKSQVRQLLTEGHRAINNNDINGLQSAVRQLYALKPGPPPSWVKEGFDTIIQ